LHVLGGLIAAEMLAERGEREETRTSPGKYSVLQLLCWGLRGRVKRKMRGGKEAKTDGPNHVSTFQLGGFRGMRVCVSKGRLDG